MPKYSFADIEYTARLLASARDNGEPFAILTGAGCSMSAGIPGARELMKQIAEEYPHLLTSLSPDERTNYGRCMGQLSSAEQRRLLRPHLDKAKINWTHIAIAGMMKAGYIARVLTFNFDNVLARACGLAGLYPPTYDFAVAPSETFQHFGHRAVLHLHGQGHGFEMFNSEERTRLHAQRLHPLLTDTFHNFPVLVVGYSGQSDAVFAEMEKIFSGRQRVLWFSYGEDVPSHVEGFLNKGGHTAQFFGGADSDKALVELARELSCFPDLFEDPYGHLLTELEEVAAHPFPVDGRGDMLNGLRAELTDAQAAKKMRGLSVEDLYRLGDWDAVIAQYRKDDPLETDFAYWAAINKADSIFDKAKSSSSDDLFAQASDLYGLATSINPKRPEAFNNWAVDLAQWARERDDVARIREAITLYEKALEIEPNHADSLSNIGSSLMTLGSLTGDSSKLREAVEQIRKSVAIDPDRHQVHNSLGNALSELAAAENDLNLFQESFESYKRSIDLWPENAIATANWANALGDLANQVSDKKILDESSAKYLQAIELNAEDASTFNNWGSDLSRFARKSGDKHLVESAIEKFERAASINPKMYSIWVNLGNTFVDLGRLDGDPASLNRSFDKFKRAVEIRPHDIRAIKAWAKSIYAYSKLEEKSGAVESAISLYENFESQGSFVAPEIALAHIVLGDLNRAKDRLFASKNSGDLPSQEELRGYPEVQLIGDAAWLQDLYEDDSSS